MKDEDEDPAVVDSNTEKLKVDGILPTGLNHVYTYESPFPTPQTPIWTPVDISPTVEYEEGDQLQLNQPQSSMAASSVQLRVQPERVSTNSIVIFYESTDTVYTTREETDINSDDLWVFSSANYYSTVRTTNTNYRNSTTCEHPLQLQARIPLTCSYHGFG
ncbi:hypothetical protein TSUD_263010 [Trifolium subterraneum]|nr:hypothetical protein TSUD_263010 [Trifolium subterraneum]